MRKIISVAWFEHSGQTFGIVITSRDGEPLNRAYIGVVAGVDEKKDMINIANYGAKFPLEAAMIVVERRGQDLINPIEVV